ncbi:MULTISPECIES: hypothetical protein [Pontibacillus]|uniref:Uncharacterized protein n=1 Tax=Pontibacillus chungwhensis TaxID=265426 RepID=A0ABY8V936_9BACI|nr:MULTISPECIES: hypothetical protein [Pontibacillus]MCD5326168.1 hypothetical protein [Pontibacillus sp. HN14]WIG00317.1 hypothetical protein QNI29_20940 [Pontibacillus chungwhensis]
MHLNKKEIEKAFKEGELDARQVFEYCYIIELPHQISKSIVKRYGGENKRNKDALERVEKLNRKQELEFGWTKEDRNKFKKKKGNGSKVNIKTKGKGISVKVNK